MKNNIDGAIMGAVVGDAIGLPFEFKNRNEIKKRDIRRQKIRGYHNQPIGTWSDDSSMIFCTMESMLKGYNIKDIGDTFCRWKYEAYWTPYGILFDIGGTTAKAIMNINLRSDYTGLAEENHCGNGSLMRIIPLLFYIKNNRENRFNIVKEVSSLTHSNMVCIIACSIYLEICLNILDGCNKKDSYNNMINVIKSYYKEYELELKLFENILNKDISKINKDELSGSGYVVSTLESSLYSFLTSKNYKDSIYKAILIGEDTDTIASITGGLSGLYYGYENIPDKWIKSIARRKEINALIDDFKIIYDE